jgi:hypothetical protein
MKVVYSDESGIGDDRESLTVVTAILLNIDSVWDQLEHDFTRVARSMPRKLLDHKHNAAGEIKGSLLFKALRGKIHGVNTKVAGHALSQILQLIPKHGIQVFHGAIDRIRHDKFYAKAGAHRGKWFHQASAFSECLKHLDDFVRSVFPKEKVLWIADHSGYENPVKHELSIFQFLQIVDIEPLLKKYDDPESRPSGTATILKVLDNPEPSSVVDTIYFGNSHESCALQIADVCCSAITQHLNGKQDGTDFYRLFRSQVITDGRPVVFSKAWDGGRRVE